MQGRSWSLDYLLVLCNIVNLGTGREISSLEEEDYVANGQNPSFSFKKYTYLPHIINISLNLACWLWEKTLLNSWKNVFILQVQDINL